MSECSEYKYLHNSDVKNSNEFKDDFFKKGLSLYEVMRVVESKPIFLEDHLMRLQKSAKKVEQFIWLDYSELVEKIKLVISTNCVVEGNIKIVFNIQENSRNFYCYFVQHKYPKKEEYAEGVHTIIYKAERSNPNAKVYDDKLRSYTNSLLENPDVYEVILMDGHDNIREGSRSNLFFIEGNTLVTAPDDEVLNGVVRKKIIEICKRIGIPVLKEEIAYNSLSKFDAAFITGTSPQVLPIKSIDMISFNVNHHLLKRLLESYRKELANYLTEF
ncbi:aminotransferase class IV [Ancylomarina sp. 16SWW S1-10-2]|uniref:aminotransferase class IV n=1 Tax=Ancylomarina sp. 16SWW S1-10-2 TaxID=2499681 RepID=UPI0012ADD70A|nr:aminotransferase class IV [Ancylomarina sp. 16SWW S1-10-2]MRT92535.1 aminotransferase class IV [Ancylomarina sp. 16SWW S1-10-2]